MIFLSFLVCLCMRFFFGDQAFLSRQKEKDDRMRPKGITHFDGFYGLRYECSIRRSEEHTTLKEKSSIHFVRTFLGPEIQKPVGPMAKTKEVRIEKNLTDCFLQH